MGSVKRIGQQKQLFYCSPRAKDLASFPVCGCNSHDRLATGHR